MYECCDFAAPAPGGGKITLFMLITILRTVRARHGRVQPSRDCSVHLAQEHPIQPRLRMKGFNIKAPPNTTRMN
jgi:hypothetical protein